MLEKRGTGESVIVEIQPAVAAVAAAAAGEEETLCARIFLLLRGHDRLAVDFAKVKKKSKPKSKPKPGFIGKHNI